MDTPTPAPYTEIAYDPEEHGNACWCNTDLTKLDAGQRSMTVWLVHDTGAACCSEECAQQEAERIEYELRGLTEQQEWALDRAGYRGAP